MSSDNKTHGREYFKEVYLNHGKKNVLDDESYERLNAAHGLMIQEPGLEKIDLAVFQEVYKDMFRVMNEPFGDAEHNDAFIVRTIYTFLFNLGDRNINCLEKAEEIVDKLGLTKKERANELWKLKAIKRRMFSEKPIVKTLILGGSIAISFLNTAFMMWAIVCNTQYFDLSVVGFLSTFIVSMIFVGIFYGDRKWSGVFMMCLLAIPIIGLSLLKFLNLT